MKKTAIVIRPDKMTAEITAKEWSLEELQEAVMGNIENVSIMGGFVIYANEEAMFKAEAEVPEFQSLFEIRDYTNGVIIGPAVIMKDNGDGTEGSFSTEELAQFFPILEHGLKFFTRKA